MAHDLFKSLGLISSKPDAQYHDAVQMYDAAHGKYVGNVPEHASVEPLLPTVAMPKAADPMPYVLKGGK